MALERILIYIDNILDPQDTEMIGAAVENTSRFSPHANPYDGMNPVNTNNFLPFGDIPMAIDTAHCPCFSRMNMTADFNFHDSCENTFVPLETSTSQGSDISSTSYESIICVANSANIADSWTKTDFESTTMEINFNNPINMVPDAISYTFNSAQDSVQASNLSNYSFMTSTLVSPLSNWFLVIDSQELFE